MFPSVLGLCSLFPAFLGLCSLFPAVLGLCSRLFWAYVPGCLGPMFPLFWACVPCSLNPYTNPGMFINECVVFSAYFLTKITGEGWWRMEIVIYSLFFTFTPTGSKSSISSASMTEGWWGSWGMYSVCSTTCGVGRERRTRSCRTHNYSRRSRARCKGDAQQFRTCKGPPCPRGV